MSVLEYSTAVQDDPINTDDAETSAEEPLKEVAQPEEVATIELQALKEAARVLRDDPDVSALLKVVRSTPDIFSEVQPILSRRDELAEAALPGELHRTFAPLFTGIALSKRARDILNFSIDRNTERETQWMLDQIRSGCTYVPEVVVGSGIHAAIYNAERISLDPENPSVTIDAETKVGGQFAQPEAPVWFLNTRTRPESPQGLHVPGAEGSLNTLGGGVLHQSDLSTEAYGSQDTLALPTRVNHLLFSKILSGTEVVKVSPNPARHGTTNTGEQTIPLYCITLKRVDTSEEFVVQTDRLILASGLGEPVTGFEKSDGPTKALLDREAAVHGSGGDARIMTFEQFAQRVGEESDPFPLRKFDKVAIIGPGDGGAVAAEYLLGHGPNARKSVVQLDRVSKVEWYGQKSSTRDEYLQNARQRYRDLGLEFPVGETDEYVHRIQPVPSRALRLEELENGLIRIHYGVRNSDGSEVITGTSDVDHIILATGFKDTTDMICADILTEDEEKTEFVLDSQGAPIARRYKGTQIIKIGPAAKLPVSKKDQAASPAMRRGKEIKGTVAVWASADESESLARSLPAIAYPGQPVNFVTRAPIYSETILPPLSSLALKESKGPIQIGVDLDKVKKTLHPGTVTDDILRFVVESRFGDLVFPPELDEITLTVLRDTNQSGEVVLQIATEEGLERNDAYRALLHQLATDELATAVLYRLTDRVHGTGVSVTMPIYNGRVEVADMFTRQKRTDKILPSNR